MTAIPKPRLSRAIFMERLPGYAGQGALLAVVAWLAWRGVSNFQANARALHLSVGFGFLHSEAGFQIAQSLIAFTPQSSYLDAIIAATLNTLLVVALAGVFSTLIGLCIAFGRLSPPGLVRGASAAYVEVFRNIPLLLQILFWYFSAIALLPGLEDSLELGPILLNNRGLFLPALQIDPTISLNRPHVEGFDVVGGFAILPELMALTLGLSIYNGAFLAEIFRAGILSVPRGQIEAAASVGLSRRRAIPDARQGVIARRGDRLSGHHADRGRYCCEPDQPGARGNVAGRDALRCDQSLHRLGRRSWQSPLAEARGTLSTHFVRQALIDPRGAPVAAPIHWRRALFPTPAIGVLSLLLLALFALFGWRFLQWSFVHAHWLGDSSEACPGEAGACWAFVIARWKPWLVGNYPS